MNEERTELWLRQTEHFCGHLWYRYTVMVNQVMTTTVKCVMTSILPLGTLGSVATLLAATKYHGNHDSNISSGISHQLRDMYYICRCYWNVAT
jgi:hypothetical protein